MADNKQLGKEQALDTQIASGLIAAGLLSDEGIAQIKNVMDGAADPPVALAHAIFQILSAVSVQLQNQNIEIDDKVWVAGGGVLDRVMFDVVNLLVEAFGFKEAASEEFITELRDNIIGLMEQDEDQQANGGSDARNSMPQPMAQGSGLLNPSPPSAALNPPVVAPPQGPPPGDPNMMGGMQ